MSEDSKQTSRINQWFIRGIGLIVASLFVVIISFVFFVDLEDSLFYNDLGPVEGFNFIILARQIGQIMWTFRVYDLILIVIILILGFISIYYLVSFKSMIRSQTNDSRRRYM